MDGLLSSGLIGLTLASQYAMISIGFTLIFGIMGVINFMHGAGYILGGYITYVIAHYLGLPFPIAVLGAVLATAAFGYLIEVLLVDRYVDDHTATMLITMGFYMICNTVIILIFGPEPVNFRFPIKGSFRTENFYFPYSSMIVLAVCSVAIAAMIYLLYFTRYGIALRAMADNREVATAQGIRPSIMFPMAFAIAMGLAALTGALVTPILALEPHLGEPMLFKAFIVVLLGGLGSVGGAMVAALIVGMVEAYAGVYLGGSKAALVLFAIVLVILLVRPTGLMGRTVRRA